MLDEFEESRQEATDEDVLCDECGRDIGECDCEIEEPISDEEY